MIHIRTYMPYGVWPGCLTGLPVIIINNIFLRGYPCVWTQITHNYFVAASFWLLLKFYYSVAASVWGSCVPSFTLSLHRSGFLPVCKIFYYRCVDLLRAFVAKYYYFIDAPFAVGKILFLPK